MADELDQDLAFRYEERPTQSPVDHPAFDPDDGWVNYWDVNPVEHGGKFIRWDGSEWRVVEVTPPSAWPEPEHIIEEYRFGPADVWEDPNDPWTDFTDDMKSILRSLRDEHHLPTAPPFLENVAYYVADLTHHVGGGRHETADIGEDVEAYWDHLERYGVDPSDVKGVADSDLPESVRNDD